MEKNASNEMGRITICFTADVPTEHLADEMASAERDPLAYCTNLRPVVNGDVLRNGAVS